MAARFPGFPQEMLTFFRGLDRNNNRDWFQKNKPVYEEKVRGPMVELVEKLNGELAKFAPDHVTDPKKAIYRIYRDTRFSKDKTPYKTHIGAIFPRRGLEKHGGGSYYFHVSPKEFLVACGAYMPGRDELLAIRTHLGENHEELRKLLGARRLRDLLGELQGERLSRAPKGFPVDHPAIDLIKAKQWYVYASLEPEVATTPDLQGEIVKRFKAARRFLEFLNAPLVARKRAERPAPLTAERASSPRRR